MKPLSNCPYCGCHLKSVKQNESWHEKYCPDHCTMEYHQYFDGDFESDRLSYISFETARFNVYVYFENGYYSNCVLFYSHRELSEHGKAGPIMKDLPSNRIPTHELEEMSNSRYDTTTQAREWLDKVDTKLHMYTLFT